MKPDLRKWPEMARLVAEELGVDAALRLVEAFGGQYIPFPRNAPGSKLAEECGIEVAELLVENYGGSSYQVPIMHDRLRAEARRQFVLDHPNLSANALARRLNCTSGRIRQIKAELRDDAPLPLFEAPRPR